MSFISVLRTITTTVLGLERVASPLVSILVPGAAPVIAIADGLISRLQNAITTVEANDPRDGQGAIKLQAVNNDLDAAIALTQEVLALSHQKLVYDQEKFKAFVAAQVTAMNLGAEFKASFKVVSV